MTDTTSTPTVELRTDDTKMQRWHNVAGKDGGAHHRDVVFRVTGAAPITGSYGDDITPDTIRIRWKDGTLDSVVIDGQRHNKDGQPGKRRDCQMYRPGDRDYGLPIDQLPDFAATALATVQPGDTDKILTNLREAMIVARALNDQAAQLATECEESGEDDGLADAYDRASDAWQTAAEYGERLDQALTNGALLPIAWRSAEHQLSPAEIKAAATGPAGWLPPVPAFTEPAAEPPASVAETAYRKLSPATRLEIADEVFTIWEFNSDGEPGCDRGMGDQLQCVDELFERHGIELTDPNEDWTHTLPAKDDDDDDEIDEPDITYHLLPGTKIPDEAYETPIVYGAAQPREIRRAWLEANAIRRTQQCDECSYDIDMANTSKANAEHWEQCSLYADNDAR